MEGIDLNFIYQSGQDLGRLTANNEFDLANVIDAQYSLNCLYNQNVYDVRAAV